MSRPVNETMKPERRGSSKSFFTEVTTNTESSAVAYAKRSARKIRQVMISRIVFFGGLVVVAAVLGFLSYYILRKSEGKQAEVRFDSISTRALLTARENVQRKRKGTVSMAETVGHFLPDADAWPFVLLPGYEELATYQMETSKARTLGLCPLVTPDQRQEFEEFAYDYFHVKRNPPFSNTTAVSAFGRGIWGKGPVTDTHPDGRYPSNVDGNTTWGSPNRVFAPILQHNSGDLLPVLMLNVNFEPIRGAMVDDLIACSKGRASSEDPRSVPCGVLTDMLNLASQKEGSGPDAIMMAPIYPRNDYTTLVGFIVSSLVWREALENTFIGGISGVDCVLSTENEVYTYEIENGIAHVKGEGDRHDRSYDAYERSIEIVQNGDFSEASAIYTLKIYPTDDFFAIYETRNPTIGAIGSLCIIALISILFYTYDCFVQKEFDANRELLEAKRRFVRFISHEVRTPLNTVCMGLTLLQEEIGESIKSPTGTLVDCTDTAESRPLSRDQVLLKRDEAEEWIELSEEILTNAHTAVGVLNDLLNYDKIQRGQLNLELSVIGIWELLQKTVNEFKLMAIEKNVTLKLDWSKLDGGDVESNSRHFLTSLPESVRGCVVVGDAIRLSQVIRNLISNGLKFTPEHGSLTVLVAIENLVGTGKKKEFTLANDERVEVPTRGQVVIDVVDTGVGMTVDQLKTVFMDGVQFNVNALQAGKGSGLGLFIAKGIVEQHDGKLEVNSEGLGKGTSFRTTLPLYYQTIEMEKSEKTRDTETQTPEEPSSQHILVVDDSAPNRKLLMRLLQNRGHTCEAACNGKEAVNAVYTAAQNPFDTILLDYEMPVMNGPKACHHIREMGCSSFIVGVTGNLMPEDVAHFRNCGANAVLPKPFKISNLEDLWMEYGITGGFFGDSLSDCEDGAAQRRVSFSGEIREQMNASN